MKKIFLILLTLFLLSGCNNENTDKNIDKLSEQNIRRIDVESPTFSANFDFNNIDWESNYLLKNFPEITFGMLEGVVDDNECIELVYSNVNYDSVKEYINNLSDFKLNNEDPDISQNKYILIKAYNSFKSLRIWIYYHNNTQKARVLIHHFNYKIVNTSILDKEPIKYLSSEKSWNDFEKLKAIPEYPEKEKLDYFEFQEGDYIKIWYKNADLKIVKQWADSLLEIGFYQNKNDEQTEEYIAMKRRSLELDLRANPYFYYADNSLCIFVNRTDYQKDVLEAKNYLKNQKNS